VQLNSEIIPVELRSGRHVPGSLLAQPRLASSKPAAPSKNAQAMAARQSPRTTKLYDRTGDEITLDEVERITI
jgi:hypothetical protein